MKEIRNILEAYRHLDFSKNKAALATVARVEGSSYRRTGARMLVLDNGTYLGGISGGCLEGDALRRAKKAISANQPSVVTYDTTRDDDGQIGVGLGCNGIIDVLFTPLDPAAPTNIIALLRERAHRREPQLLATLTQCKAMPGALGHTLPFEDEAQWLRDFPIPGLAKTVLADAQACLENGETRTFDYPETPVPEKFSKTQNLKNTGDEVRVCLEVLLPATHLVLFGSNNDICPVARIGKELGWDLTVVTNPLKAEKPLFSMANKVLDPKSGEQPKIDAFTAIVLMAHDYKTDLQNLKNLLRSEARYIGLLGPRKRAQKMFEALETGGRPVSDQNMARIFAPAGLDIGAVTPEEIALSIAAEIRACFAGRTGRPLRLRAGAIHET